MSPQTMHGCQPQPLSLQWTALKSSTDLLHRNRLFSVLTSEHVDLSELARLAGPVPRFKLGSGVDGIGTSGHVAVGDGGRTGVNAGLESSLKSSSLSRSP